MKPLISVVILNWNGEDFIGKCIDSVRNSSYRNLEIIVVDNASNDRSIEKILNFDNITLIKNEKNLGYAAANNIGFSKANGKYVVALNNDIFVEPDWLNDVVRYMEADDSVGIAGCRQMRYGQENVIDGLFHVVDKYLRISALGSGKTYDGELKSVGPGYVLGVNGGSAVYRKVTYESLNGLDDRFFGYYEDADLYMRAFLNGWKTVYVPSAVVKHMGSTSFKKDMNRYYFLLERNRLYFLFKNFPVRILIKFLPLLLYYELRNLRGFSFGMKKPSLYFNSRLQALRLFKELASERAYNTSLFRKKEKMFWMYYRNQIVPLKLET